MAGNKCNHRFSYIITDIFSCLFFRISSNLSNQDDCFCFRIILKHFQQLAKVKPYNRIAPDADSGRLSHSISC